MKFHIEEISSMSKFAKPAFNLVSDEEGHRDKGTCYASSQKLWVIELLKEELEKNGILRQLRAEKPCNVQEQASKESTGDEYDQYREFYESPEYHERFM